jgi:hypothetical protein
MPITKPFVIATSGPTIDGRVISRQQIEDMAKNYDSKIYTAPVNLEHIMGYMPDSVFSSYGKVIKLGTRETTIFGEKQLQLTAVADVSEAAVAWQQQGKKAFASIEMTSNFTGRGIAYLTGLALTDIPASLGTEKMRFSALEPKDAIRFAFAAETAFEADEPPKSEPAPETGLGEKLFSRVKDLLNLSGKNTDARFSDHAQAVTVLAESQRELLERVERAQTAFAARLEAAEASLKARTEEFAALNAGLSSTPASPARPAATGGANLQQTNC